MTLSDFLPAIIVNPDDDQARLIAADWLDENGGNDRAEFIRVQIALERCSACKPTDLMCQVCGADSPLRQREAKLLHEHRSLWLLQTFVAGGQLDLTQQSQTLILSSRFLADSVFRRGFVAAITCSWPDWSAGADAILKATPLKEVKLTTRLPHNWRVDWNSPEPKWPKIKFTLPPYYNPENFIADQTPSAETLIRGNPAAFDVDVGSDTRFHEVPGQGDFDGPQLESLCQCQQRPISALGETADIAVRNVRIVTLPGYRWFFDDPASRIRTIRHLYVGQCRHCRTILYAEGRPQYITHIEMAARRPRGFGVLRFE